MKCTYRQTALPVAAQLGPQGDARFGGVLWGIFKTPEMRIPPWHWFSWRCGSCAEEPDTSPTAPAPARIPRCWVPPLWHFPEMAATTTSLPWRSASPWTTAGRGCGVAGAVFQATATIVRAWSFTFSARRLT